LPVQLECRTTNQPTQPRRRRRPSL
jgi:hypothetical protein